MLPGLVAAFATALCYGAGTVLQAIGARRTERVEGLDPRLLVRLLRSWPYVVGLTLDGLGFLLSLVAVRSLPLFVVQAVVASSLAFTAVLGAAFLKLSLDRRDGVSLGVVICGLALVTASAAEDRSVHVSTAESYGALVVAIVLVGAAVAASRLAGARGASALGAVAGLAFGVTAVAARILPGGGSVDALLRSPAMWGLMVAGFVAVLAHSTALQRGTVTQVTAPAVVAETIGPALVGLLLLGDQARPGWGWVGALGFILAVGGAVGLARYGEAAD